MRKLELMAEPTRSAGVNTVVGGQAGGSEQDALGQERLPARAHPWQNIPVVSASMNEVSGSPAVRSRQPPVWQSSASPGWLPLVLLPGAAVAVGSRLAPWLFMWSLAMAIYAGLKWLTWWQARRAGIRPSARRSLAYLLAWPGMDAPAFLRGDRPPRPSSGEWLAAAGKTALGAILFWGLARQAVPHPLIAGWIGLFGLIFFLHFGSFHLASLLWRTLGIDARPIMAMPVLATSVAELWGRRWNLAFHVLARDLLLRPLHTRVGPSGATLAVFLVSGLIHDLVISLPARGGYGLPTAYFVLQGIGVLLERSPLGQRARLRRGWPGRLTAVAIAGGPAFWLFHPPFVTRVIVPFMQVVGALG